MSTRASTGRRAWLGTFAAFVVWAGVLFRIVASASEAWLVPWYLGGMALYLVVHAVVLWRPPRAAALLHVAFALQVALVLVLFALDPEQDIFTGLLALLCYQAAVVFAGRVRIVWVAGLVALMPVALVLGTDWLSGLAEAFVPKAAGVVLAMLAVVSRDLEDAETASRQMVAELREAQRQVEAYAGQAEELATLDARSRVARELQSSVSATVADVVAATRAAREAGGTPQATAALLERVQTLAHTALAQMRGVITELRPPAE